MCTDICHLRGRETDLDAFGQQILGVDTERMYQSNTWEANAPNGLSGKSPHYQENWLPLTKEPLVRGFRPGPANAYRLSWPLRGGSWFRWRSIWNYPSPLAGICEPDLRDHQQAN